MKEEVVRQVMRKYFASKSIKTIPSKGAGPDLLRDGKAVEVKGSKYDFKRMLTQLKDYAYKFSEVSLVLPYDGLTLERIERLIIFNGLIKEARGISLKVYLLAPHSEQRNIFYVYDTPNVERIRAMMTAVPQPNIGFSLKDPHSTIGNAVENLLTYSFVQNMKQYICSDYDHKVSKVEL